MARLPDGGLASPIATAVAAAVAPVGTEAVVAARHCIVIAVVVVVVVVWVRVRLRRCVRRLRPDCGC